MKKYDVIAKVYDDDNGRIARTFDSRKSAENMLTKAFGNPIDGVWTDSLGQSFRIIEVDREA